MNRRTLAVLSTLPLAATVVIAAPTQAAVPQCHGLDATIIGTDGPDHLIGTEGPDVVWLGAGRDVFAGKGGDDVICGGSGSDKIYPGAGNDTVFGESGNDSIIGGDGNDILDGGGDAYDRLSYHESGVTGLRLDLRNRTATKDSGTDTVTGFAIYTGTPGADTLIGTTTDDRFYGDGGDDLIYGFGGNDHINVHDGSPTIYGGDGDDGVATDHLHDSRIVLGAGNDTILFRHLPAGNRWTGGPGVDSLAPTGSGLRMEINLNQNFLRIISTGARSSIAGFENASGSYGKDRIVGNSSANRLRGNGGDDTLIGLAGDDVLLGEVARSYYEDHIDGGDGADTCRGWNVVNCEKRVW